MADEVEGADQANGAPGQTARWMAVARLLRPQGRRGELLTEPLSDLPGLLEAGRKVWLVAGNRTEPAAAQAPVAIEESWAPAGRNAGRLVLKLSGCESISDAERLAGLQVLLPVSHLPALDPDTFMVADLLGCLLLDGAEEVGRVVEVQFAVGPDGRTRLPDAAPLLAVELTPLDTPLAAGDPPPSSLAERTEVTGKEHEAELLLIPFVQAWLQSVDLPGKRIVMHLPQGLVDRSPSAEPIH